MKKLLEKYFKMSFEEKTIFTCYFSCLFNLIIGVFKIILGVFLGIFFIIAGIINIMILLAKLECYLGVKHPKTKSFTKRNKYTSIYLLLAGFIYAIYMSRFIFLNQEIYQYQQLLGIGIATVSFVELGVSIKGCFNAYGRGHYYRNIKLINLCSSFTAIMLTMVAITSFASEEDMSFLNGLCGMITGVLIILIAIYILIAPKISIVDKEVNHYQLINGTTSKLLTNNQIQIKLTNSKICGNYIYYGIVKGNIIEGMIVKEKSPLCKLNICWKIIIIILSEILIFYYAFYALIFHFRSAKIIKQLDEYMDSNNFRKINEVNKC